jgi:hypothetical protein
VLQRSFSFGSDTPPRGPIGHKAPWLPERLGRIMPPARRPLVRVSSPTLSKPIKRMMDEPPPGLLSNAKFNVMEEDEHQQN